jgi:hypothetical protein
MNYHCLTVLDKLGYIPVPSKVERIVSKSIKKSFESLFGQTATVVILNHLASFYGLSEKELTTNYDIFDKSLHEMSSYGASIILRYLKKEMLIESISASSGSEITEQDILNPDIGIGDIIKKISYDEITQFVHGISAGEHITFIYKNEDTKCKVLSAFFDESHHHHHDDIVNSQIISTMALISNKQTKFSYINNILHYEDLLVIEKSEIINKIWDWMNCFNNKINSDMLKEDDDKEIEVAQDKDIVVNSSAIRIAIEDATWFLLNNFRHEFLSIEKIVKKYISNNKCMSVLCTYKISDISGSNDDDIIMRIIESHGSVILEDPLIRYKSTKP